MGMGLAEGIEWMSIIPTQVGRMNLSSLYLALSFAFLSFPPYDF